MRKIIALFGALGLLGVSLFLAAPASATQKDTTKTVVWEMPGWDGNKPVWPQAYVASALNVGLDIGIEAECGWFQVDVYRYESESDIAKVDALIAGGVLTGPSQPLPEPLISGGLGTAWKFVNLGECVEDDEPTPDPTPSETVTITPDPTPTETTPTPTPTETSETPTPTPTESTPTSTPTKTTTPPDGPDTLPRTGAPTPLIAGLGSLLAVLGAGALWLTRKPGLHE